MRRGVKEISRSRSIGQVLFISKRVTSSKQPKVSECVPVSWSSANRILLTSCVKSSLIKKTTCCPYTFQNSYHDNDVDSSTQRSLLVNSDVTAQMVIEEKERTENRKTGLDFTGKRTEIFNGVSNNVQMTEVSKRNSYTNNNNNNHNFYGMPDFNYGGYSHSNHTLPQEFDTNYQSSQHSEFGNAFSEISDYQTSSQHSFSNPHDDEFVPKVFPTTTTHTVLNIPKNHSHHQDLPLLRLLIPVPNLPRLHPNSRSNSPWIPKTLSVFRDLVTQIIYSCIANI